jgi:hypothetical protein
VPTNTGAGMTTSTAAHMGTRGVSETQGSPTFSVEISECPCACQTCGQLVDDGRDCQLCRVGLHEASDE